MGAYWLKLIRLWAWPVTDRVSFAGLALAVLVIEAGIHLMSYRRVVRWLSLLRTPVLTRGPAHSVIARYEKFLLHLAARPYPFAGRCLARSLALWWRLRQHGIDTEVRFGVRKRQGLFDAHAWVEYQGQPLAREHAAPQEFHVITGMALPPAVPFR